MDSTGSIFDFADLDGISRAKCSVCPPPVLTLTSEEKKNEGQVLLSVVFAADGKLDQMRLVRGLEPALDQAAMEAVKNWKAEPAKDAMGNTVSVRQLVTTTFNYAVSGVSTAATSELTNSPTHVASSIR